MVKYDIYTFHDRELIYSDVEIRVKKQQSGDNSILECEYGDLIPLNLIDNLIKYKMIDEDGSFYVVLIKSNVTNGTSNKSRLPEENPKTGRSIKGGHKWQRKKLRKKQQKRQIKKAAKRS